MDDGKDDVPRTAEIGENKPGSPTLGMTGSPFDFASLRSPLGSIATDVDPFELAVAVRAPREMAVVVRDIAHEVNGGFGWFSQFTLS